jgi:hypothetical protein
MAWWPDLFLFCAELNDPRRRTYDGGSRRHILNNHRTRAYHRTPTNGNAFSNGRSDAYVRPLVDANRASQPRPGAYMGVSPNVAVVIHYCSRIYDHILAYVGCRTDNGTGENYAATSNVRRSRDN